MKTRHLMRVRALAAYLCGLVLCFFAAWNAQGQFVNGCSKFGAEGFCNPVVVAAGGGCADSVTFLARGTFDAGHTTAYQNFICGLNTDGIGIFTSVWDVLVILGTQTGQALINLSSTSFTPTLSASAPSFVADRGYTGTDSSATVYIDTGWAPVSAVNLTNTNAHVSVWSNTNVQATAGGGSCLALTNGAANSTRIFLRYSDGNAYLDMDGATQNPGSAIANATGHYLITRSAATAGVAYKNATSIFSSTTMNSAFTALTAHLFILANNDQAAGITVGCGNQIAMYSIGRNLTGTQVTNFYNRLRTLGTALGWP